VPASHKTCYSMPRSWCTLTICEAYKCGRDTLTMQKDGTKSWHKSKHICLLFCRPRVYLAACHAVNDVHAWAYACCDYHHMKLCSKIDEEPEPPEQAHRLQMSHLSSFGGFVVQGCVHQTHTSIIYKLSTAQTGSAVSLRCACQGLQLGTTERKCAPVSCISSMSLAMRKPGWEQEKWPNALPKCTGDRCSSLWKCRLALVCSGPVKRMTYCI